MKGGVALPLYIDPCLPLTYTSSDKLMLQGTSGLDDGSSLKRKLTEKIQVGGTAKKACLDPIKKETLKAEDGKKDIKLDKPAFKTKPRLFIDNYTTNETLTFFELLSSDIRHSQTRIVDLEKELVTRDTQRMKENEDLQAKWTRCYDKKKEEVEKLKVELEVSDGLLRSSKSTVTEQEKKLAVLAKTQLLL